jgi:hypothetical protein
MCDGSSVVFHFDFKRLIKIILHETEHILFVREKLKRRIRPLEIKVKETVGDTAMEELGNFGRIFRNQMGEVNSLERGNVNPVQGARSG